MSEPDPAAPRVASPNLSTAAMSVQADPDRVVPRKQVVSWAMWDWATQPFNSVLLTFVFVPLYLVSANFLPADVAAQNADGALVCNRGADAATEYCGGLADLSEWYGWATFLAGILILVLAPVLGQRADVAGNKKRWVVGATAVLALIQFALFFAYADPAFFWFGAVAVALGAVTSEIAGVNYNAMLVEVSTPRTVGRVSGLGWGLGYIGGILALVLVVVLDRAEWFGMDTSDGLAYRLMADHHRMDDALQEAYLKAYRALPRFRAGSDFGTWLYRITYNACIDELRKRKRSPVSSEDPVDPVSSRPGPDRIVSASETVRHALAELPIDQRVTVVLVDGEGFDHREAAEILGVAPGTVASRLHRARAALRRVLGEEVR